MNRYISLGLVAAATVLAGCATPRDGSDQTTHYYANRPASRPVAGVRVNPAPPKAERGPIGVARIVYFDFDKSTIRPADRSVVEAHANYLRARRGESVVLEGHTDVRGGREYNLALGQRRSESVKKAMGLLGVDTSQIEAVSWGTEKPASLEQTEAGYQLNRRVEFSYR